MTTQQTNANPAKPGFFNSKVWITTQPFVLGGLSGIIGMTI